MIESHLSDKPVPVLFHFIGRHKFRAWKGISFPSASMQYSHCLINVNNSINTHLELRPERVSIITFEFSLIDFTGGMKYFPLYLEIFLIKVALDPYQGLIVWGEPF